MTSNVTIDQNAAMKESLDAFFHIVMAITVYFMQCGFAFLEAGSVRSKNTTNILIKNILDSFIGGLAYFVIGWALAFGKPGNAFCGSGNFALAELPDSQLHFWFFQFVHAATASTIVSGAVAERCEFVAYVMYSCVITGIVYPIASHWVWSPVGWLNQGFSLQNDTLISTYTDFAGSGVVHVTGGVAAFVAAAFLGPRLGRFDPDSGEPQEIRGHSLPLASLGGFILFFGFFAFNGGSQRSITGAGDGDAVALAMVNTILSASCAAFTTLLLNRVTRSHWSLLHTVNGALAGMVAASACCNIIRPWGACVLGLMSAGCCSGISALVLRLRVDDPLEAVAVHFGGGACGVVMTAFLHSGRGIFMKWNAQSGFDLLVQLLGLVAFIGWSAVISILIFGLLRVFRVFRVSPEMEMKGLDIPKHGEMAYPLIAYGHGWIEDAAPEISGAQQLPELATMMMQKKQPLPELVTVTSEDEQATETVTTMMHENQQVNQEHHETAVTGL